MNSVSERNQNVNLQSFAELQIDTYKRVAHVFDSVTNRENRNHLNKIKAINEFLNIQNSEKVLEIGVGTGIHARHILDLNRTKIFDFFGVDISEEMLHEARKKLGDKVFLDKMPGEDLKFEDGYFDKVYISGSLHHFTDPKKGVDELLRVLKPGGRFCIMEPNFIFPKNFLATYWLPEERHMKFMKKKFFMKWLNDHQGIKYEISNFAYTPFFPQFLIGFFDIIDRIISKTPFVRNLSIMLFIKGQK